MIRTAKIFASLLTTLMVVGSPTLAGQAGDADQYRACVLLTQRDAEGAFESALAWRDAGGGFPARHCVGLALLRLGQPDDAAGRFEKLAEDMSAAGESLVAPVLAQAGNAWLLAGNFARADAVFTTALKLEPENVDLLIDRARALAAGQDFTAALADLNLALSLDPLRDDALGFRASARRNLNHMARALEDAETALIINPYAVDALIERGILRLNAGDRDAARQDWMEVLRLSPDSPAGSAARYNLEAMDVNKDK